MKDKFCNRFAVSFTLMVILCHGVSIAGGHLPLELALLRKQATEYKLARFTYEGRDVKLPEKPALTVTLIAPERVAGFAGVNRYFGAFRIGGQERIYWQTPGFGATVMAGPQELMDLEQLFLQALARTMYLRIDSSGIRFETHDGAIRLEFVERGKGEAVAELRDAKLVLVRMVLNNSEIPLSTDSPIILKLGENGQLSGAAPINRYLGGYTLSADGTFQVIASLATTRMTGPSALMALENAFLEALGRVSRLDPAEGGVALWNEDKSVLLEFLQQ